MSILSLQKQSQNTDFPNLRPSLDLRFALAKKLDPRITFTRGSTGTYFGPDGLMKTAIANEPRFDHNPITGQSLGLLIEESRQNLLTYSNDYSASPGGWTFEGKGGLNTGGTRTQDLVGPDGVANNAWTIFDNDTAVDLVRFYKQISITASLSTNYCVSSFIKPISTTNIDLYVFFLGSSVKGSVIRYNVLTDTITPFAADGGGITPTIYGRIKYPNGWVRLYFVVNDANSGANTILQYRIYPSSRDAGTIGAMGLYGSQIEIGSSPTSYIPTTASTVTRSADLASMEGTNFSSWYNQNEGTIYMELDKLYSGNFDAYRHPYRIDSGSNADQITAYTLPGATTITNYGISTGGRSVNDYQQINIGSSPIRYKLGQSVNSKYFFFTTSTGRVPPQLPSSSSPNGHNLTLPTNMTRLYIGSTSTGNHMNSHIGRFTYYPIALTQNQLINLTS